MPEKAALYARVSTDNQDIKPQVDELTKWAKYEDLDAEVFKDDGVSAVAETRPAFDYMMSCIDDFDVVAVTELDRFGRSVDQLSTWAGDLEERGIELVILERNIDTSTIEGQLLFNLLSVFADYERKLTNERMKAGYEKALDEGRVGRPEAEVDMEWLKDKRAKGAGVSYLAEELGVSRSTVYDRLDRLSE